MTNDQVNAFNPLPPSPLEFSDGATNDQRPMTNDQ
jgi:hypothetical protein